MLENVIKIKTLSSMEKVFPRTEPTAVETSRSMLQNEKLNFQIALYNDAYDTMKRNSIEIQGGLAPFVSVRTVEYVPGTYFPLVEDEYYIKHELTIYPDVLKPLGSLGLVLPRFQWKSVWISVYNEQGLPTGSYPLTFTVKNEAGEVVAETSYTVEVVKGFLEPCDIKLTNWMHYDSIAHKHNVKPFSNGYYKVFEKYLDAYVGIGFNTLLTPLFTPPLDTAVGHERLTAQLIDIKKDGGRYAFNFAKLKKFLRFAFKHGVRYIEFSHLFTQWGGEFCPKIMATVDGVEQRIFGWDTSATSVEYKEFLSAFLPALVQVIDEMGIREKCLFHLTDEPQEKHLENYAKCRQLVKSHIGDLPIMDAMSHYAFYEQGLVDIPVAITPTYQDFADHNVENLFVYYCCGPAGDSYSNRFFNMPSQRTRILGIQLYQSGVKGFLHWGYNFYNSAYSLCEVDPYAVTDAGGMFPSGDSYIVYPTKDGVDLSLRAESTREGFQDYQALRLLEKKIGKDKTKALVAEFGVDKFNVYPKSLEAHTSFREKINMLIKNS
ncbi:MAG: DUF4091 domain-containing protein [Clostridia bacterium]|nr:DUF4091 domain-containing protein [Clostridia bacterium]